MAGIPWEQWQVEYNSGIPVYRQISNQVCAAVAAGAFKPGDRLPTIRALHERLKVNPNTVAKAYRELELKGIIESERGSGSFIKAQPPAPRTGEKKARLKTIYLRLLAEAASSGLTESELLNYLKERNVPTS
ncbi:MAG: GntR family transcriptional regulator [Verrucomicrobiota bacterium]|jgi:GntR family transcriptional regulator